MNGSDEGNIITIAPSGSVGQNDQSEEGLSALPTVIQPEVVEPVPGKKKPDRVEKEIHRKALAFYFALGPTRTLAKVGQEFKLKEATI